MRLNKQDHPWLTDKKSANIFAALPKGSARFVGGCVRNSLLGEPIGDVDLSTQLTPPEVMAALDSAQIRYVETGVDYGTITAVVDGVPFEITSLRRDVQTDGRRAVVAFTQDWVEDAQRRDLTMNALYAGPDGKVYDPTGQGLDDVKARRFRFVGEAEMRVREDYLRILRFFRFIAWYGKGSKIDAASLTACREHRDGIRRLSAERIWSELKKLLGAPDPVRAIRIMHTNEILDVVLPEASNVEGLALLIELERANLLEADFMRRLMAMAGRDEVALAALARRLKFSKSEKSRLLGWAGDRTAISADMDAKSAKQAIYKIGSQAAQDRFIIRAAGVEGAGEQDRWLSLAALARAWQAPEFPITGKDLKAQGIKPGPEMGRVLDALKALWVKSGFKAGREQLLMALALMQSS